MTPAVFLDRDGVLNRLVERDGVPVSPRWSADFELIDRAIEAVGRFHTAGYPCVVVTNQPDLGRGLLQTVELEAMHERLRSVAPFAGIYVCPHAAADECECRKPSPGMLVQAAGDLGLDLPASWMIGDRWVDVAAGTAAGCRSILIEHEFSLAPTSSGSPAPLEIEATVPDLWEAAEFVLARGLPRDA